MIQVSVGLCVKNSEKIVKEAINSVINQDFPHEHMEIIVVDDGSKDKTLSVITNSVSQTDIKTKVYSTGGGGLGVARQMVVNNACGKYIIWVDDDFELLKDFVRKKVEFMERNPRLGAAQGTPILQARQRNPDHKRTPLLIALENIKISLFMVMDRKNRKEVEHLGTGGSIFRVEAIRQVGGFDQRIVGAAEDVDVTIRIKRAGWLLARTNARFSHKIKPTWKGQYARSSWHGYGSHYIGHKYKGGTWKYLWLQIPPAAFLIGLRRSPKAYKLTHRKISFLLPFQHVWESLAWCVGFFKSHIDGYGHDMGKYTEQMG